MTSLENRLKKMPEKFVMTFLLLILINTHLMYFTHNCKSRGKKKKSHFIFHQPHLNPCERCKRVHFVLLKRKRGGREEDNEDL